MSAKEITDKELTEVLNQEGTQFFYAFASWCGTCRFFAPKFNEVAEKNSELKFYKIDAENNKDFSSKVDIDNLPFVAVFNNGKYIGGKSTSKVETVENMIQMAKEKLS